MQDEIATEPKQWLDLVNSVSLGLKPATNSLFPKHVARNSFAISPGFDEILIHPSLLLSPPLLSPCSLLPMGSRDGAVVRALAFHQCGPGSIPGPGVIRGLSLLLVLYSVPRFFSRYSGFPLFSKTNISKFQFDPGMHGHFWTSSLNSLVLHG